jgi:sterol desaturase/sphingolipid hydroxylase (fatty acid hydroxylase superfamily)
MMIAKVPIWLSVPLIVGTFGVLLWLERRSPLRRKVEPKLTRDVRNLAVAFFGAVALQLTESPVSGKLATLVEQRNWGMLKIGGLPAWLEVPLAVLLLDYSLYVWHVLTHKVPFLWRFHLVHHVDRELDASTALRFHFGELILSVPWRAAQIVLIGVSPFSFSVWQTLLFMSILFHHSNVRLPIAWERRLNLLIVTPRMHGIHHSTVRQETDSNWSSGLTIWDRLHGTLRLNVPQDEITIGVPAYKTPTDVEFVTLVRMPFAEQKPNWESKLEDEPARRVLAAPSNRLLE